MKYLENEGDRIVISVGGSLIVPDEIDIGWLGEFKKTVEKYTKRGYKFAIVAGGGRTSRKYQEAAKSYTSNEGLDWLGIYGTRLNAYLLKTVLGSKQEIIEDPTEKIEFGDIVIASGWKPGFSTDYVAVLLARNLGVRRIANLTNIDYVYDRDPKHLDARRIEEISWEDFREIVGDSWNPGMNTPFDPVASREAERLGMEVAVINGKDIRNFENYLRDGKGFKGTLIRCLSRTLGKYFERQDEELYE